MALPPITYTHEGIIYVRYSSHAQRDVSIEQQIRACRAFAERQGIRIVEVYEDRALSGTSDKRPGFQRMIQDAERSNWSYVIVYTLDRFARDRYASAIYKRKLKDYGVKVLSAMENISDDPTGVLMESLLEGLAEYYSKELSQKVRRGHEDNARKCMVNGMLPLGYVRGEDGRYATYEPEADLVREVFTRVNQSEPLADIIRDLNARGLRTKKGKQWNRSSFNQMLTNERYTGVYLYQDIRIPGGIPQIIPQDLFDSVQCKIQTKTNSRRDPTGTRPQRRRREKGTYLLTGKLFCGNCKHPMTGVSGTSKTSALHFYYTCKGRRADHTSCSKKNVRRDHIESFVTTALREALFTDSGMAALADSAVEYQRQNSGFGELITLKDQLADTERSLANLMRAIEAGIFSSTTQARLQELEDQKRTLTRQIALAEADAADVMTREDYLALLEMFRHGDVNDNRYQEALIDTFLVAAYVYDDKVKFVFNLGKENSHTEVPFDIDSIDTNEVRANAPPGDHSLLYEHSGIIVIMVSGLFVFTKSI